MKIFLPIFHWLTVWIVVFIAALSPNLQAQTYTFEGISAVEEDFGNGTNRIGPELPPGTTIGLTYKANPIPITNDIVDGQYTISKSSYVHRAYIDRPDHTGDIPGKMHGYMMVIGANLEKGIFYQKNFTGLCGGTSYDLSFYGMSLSLTNDPIYVKPIVKMEVLIDGVVRGTRRITLPHDKQWHQGLLANVVIPSGASTVKVRLTNDADGGYGNDLAIDDIVFKPSMGTSSVNYAYSMVDGSLLYGDHYEFPETFTPKITITPSDMAWWTSASRLWEYSTDGGSTWISTSSNALTYNVSTIPVWGSYGGDPHKKQIMLRVKVSSGASGCDFHSKAITFVKVSAPDFFHGPPKQGDLSGNMYDKQCSGDEYALVAYNNKALAQNTSLYTLTADSYAGNIEGKAVTYKWFRHNKCTTVFAPANFDEIPGQTGSILYVDESTLFPPAIANCSDGAGNLFEVYGYDTSGAKVYYSRFAIFNVLLTLSTNNATISCANPEATITATLRAKNFPDTYTYNWFKQNTDGTFTALSPTTSTLTVTEAGTYKVIVETEASCPREELITISGGGSITFTTAQTDLSCNGALDGAVTITTSGGTAPYAYYVDDVLKASNVVTGLTGGNHTIKVKDASGCESSVQTINLTEPAALTSSAVVDQHVSINGGTDGELTVTAGGGVAPYEYSLDGTTFQASATFSGLGAGMYTITTRDANGCETTTSVTIIEPGSLVLSAVIDQAILCNGDANGQLTATVTGGVAPYEYSLDGTTFQASGTFSGLIAGTYTVTVKDANGAVGTTALTLTEPAALTSSAVVDQHVSINGGTDGELTVTAGGGVAPYEYSLDGTTFQASATFSGLGAGMYTITTRDANGCETTTSVTIIEPGSLVLSAVIDQAILCNGDANGQLTATVTGGVAPYEYSLDGTTFQASGTFSGLIAGTYTVTVKDANGAVGTTALTLTEPAALTSSAVVDQHVSINGGTDGELTVTAGGGVAPYEYSLDGTTFQASATFSGLGAGMYTITTRDANGCETTTSVTIIEPGSLVLSAVIDQAILCNGDANGQLTATVTGGVAPYEYSLDGTTFQASGTFSGLIAGTYTVTVKDANGAVGTTALTLTEPAALTSSAVVDQHVSINGGTDGELTVTAGGGVAPYEYSLDGTTFQASATFSGLGAGMYTITTRDANGCETTTSVTIIEPGSLVLSAVIDQAILCNGDANGQLTATVTGGVAPYEYSLDGTTFQASGTFSGLIAGTYTVTVKDANGAVGTTALTLTEPAVVSFTTRVTPTSCNGMNDGQLTVTTSGGTSPYEYSLDGTTFQASATFSGLVAGMYTITTRDANGCTTASQEETLTEPLALSLPVVDTLVEYCAEDVAPVLTATNSNPSISFNWYDAGGSLLGSGSNLDLAGLGLGAGTYYVESTSNSCTSTQVMLEVVAMVTPIPEIQEMNGNILNDQLYGTFEGDDVALQVTPIDPNLAIVWTTVGGTNATTATLDIMNISGADAGDYTVSYTQSIGMSGFCEATAKTTLVVLQTAEEALGEDIYKCEEASVTFSYPDDARLGLTYSWTGPDGFSSSDSSITVSTSGNYNLQVTTKEGLVSEGEVYLAVSDLAVTVSESCYGQVILQPQGGVGPYEYSLNGGAWQASPIFKEVSQGTNVYQVRDAKFCEESITHTDQAFTLRQAFSPNGDGINEYWDLTSLSGCSRMEVNIFDRYGRLLHQLNASNPTWDGASKGKHQPSGTYWFVIDFKDSNTPTLKSHVTIKRTQE